MVIVIYKIGDSDNRAIGRANIFCKFGESTTFKIGIVIFFRYEDDLCRISGGDISNII
jgi:hypothetical protein